MNIDSVKKRYRIIGNNSKLNLAIENAVKAAPTDLTVLVSGESGVGKDIFARMIHEYSNRSKKNLVAVNCGAFPEGIIESALFGHIKGAFTGADHDSKGYFREADGGTIFLDEVGELPLPMQVKLLRVLQNGEIIPVGESKPQKVDVRVVAATNADVEKAVREGRFRPDLYYRLNQMSISIPPLRERPEDIPLIFSSFAADIAAESNRPAIMLADESAREYLMHYPWHGNVRELRTIVLRIAWLESERLITREILQRYLPPATESNMPVPVGFGVGNIQSSVSDHELLLKTLSMGQVISEMREELYDLRRTVEQLKQGGVASPTIVTPPPAHVIDPHTPIPTIISHQDDAEGYDGGFTPAHVVDDTPAEIADDVPLDLGKRERQAIVKALSLHKGNRKLAAQELGISERTLYRRIKALSL
ncbi:MAG: sigma-54-dependent Fis family transcriptional regulator [Bacteroidales bacterium]|nr:sigma-54-dependent Fis family transcriptional regulator [Bacteroidales bacterium]